MKSSSTKFLHGFCVFNRDLRQNMVDVCTQSSFLFQRFLSLMRPDEEIMRKIEEENGLCKQEGLTMVCFIQ